MNFRSVYKKFDNAMIVVSRKMGAKSSAKHYFKLLKQHNIPIKRLTKEQKKAVDDFWGKKNGKNYATHELVLSATGRFDPKICEEKLFRTEIELKLNRFDFKGAWSDKGYFDFLFPDVKFPETVVRNIKGNFYDHDYNIITKEQAIKLLDEIGTFAIKPSLESGCGRGVQLFKKGEGQTLDQLLNEYNSDYVAQKVLSQYAPIAALNPSSVNVIRYISLYINGKVTPVSAALRCGAGGAFNDNCVTPDGRGMFVIGVSEDGVLKDEAYHSCGEKITKAPNGAEFAGITIPNFDRIKQLTTDIHSKLAHFGFVGFDIAIDADGEPVVMEYNIKGPGVLYYQYVNGPLLGDRTDEIAELLKQNRL